ncbi:MAG: hypothetical protein Q7R59_01885 [bacterium]|nr:hypothetical protein [bacterium]
MRLDVRDNTILQKPLDLSTVYRIAREPVYLPAHNPLRLALLYPRHHLIENRTPRHLRGLLFYEYLNDVELFLFSESAQLGQLCVNGQNLFVLDIG